MSDKIKLWYYRNFCILSEEEAVEIGLTPVRNVYGDEILHWNCRSLWKDEKGRIYRIKSLTR